MILAKRPRSDNPQSPVRDKHSPLWSRNNHGELLTCQCDNRGINPYLYRLQNVNVALFPRKFLIKSGKFHLPMCCITAENVELIGTFLEPLPLAKATDVMDIRYFDIISSTILTPDLDDMLEWPRITTTGGAVHGVKSVRDQEYSEYFVLKFFS